LEGNATLFEGDGMTHEEKIAEKRTLAQILGFITIAQLESLMDT
jgi:hypothetical protein